MEIQGVSKNGNPTVVQKIGDEKLFETMEIQDGSHNGDPWPFPKWRAEDGAHNVHKKVIYTMEISSSSYNGYPCYFKRMKSKAG